MTALPQNAQAASQWGKLLTRIHIDPWLVGMLFLLGLIGIATQYSATGQSLNMMIGQFERLSLGLFLMVIVAQIPPDLYRAAAPWFFGVSVLLLILVLLLGSHAKGAQRWLDLGVVKFQPSEMMKLAMPMMVSAWLHSRPLPPRPRDVIISLILILGPFVLVAIQPDLGTALLIVAGGGFALFLGGLGWRWIASALAAIAAIAPLAWYRLHNYQRQRVLTFMDPERDPLGAGYHITQSKIAIGSGGAFGKGWLNGTQAHLDFLPEAHTDFIFAVFSEEMGLLGITALLLLYACIVGRGLFIALRGHDTFQRLLAASLAMTFFLYVFINMGMVIGLLPVVGVPLPLMSYGGTAAVTLLVGFGMLMSIHTHRKLLSS